VLFKILGLGVFGLSSRVWSQVEQKWQEKVGGESRWVAGTGLGERKGGHGGESSTQWVRTSRIRELKREIKESDISTNGQSWASHEEIKRYTVDHIQ